MGTPPSASSVKHLRDRNAQSIGVAIGGMLLQDPGTGKAVQGQREERHRWTQTPLPFRSPQSVPRGPARAFLLLQAVAVREEGFPLAAQNRVRAFPLAPVPPARPPGPTLSLSTRTRTIRARRGVVHSASYPPSRGKLAKYFSD